MSTLSTTVSFDLETWPHAHVSVRQLAAYFGIAPKTIHSMIHEGALPARRIGKQFRIRTSDARRAFPAVVVRVAL